MRVFCPADELPPIVIEVVADIVVAPVISLLLENVKPEVRANDVTPPTTSAFEIPDVVRLGPFVTEIDVVAAMVVAPVTAPADAMPLALSAGPALSVRLVTPATTSASEMPVDVSDGPPVTLRN